MDENKETNPGAEAAPTTDDTAAGAAAADANQGNDDSGNSGPDATTAAEEAVLEPTPEERLAEAEQATLAMRDKMLRVAADFDNYRKRAIRDADDAGRRGKKSVVVELLPVFDNLERALAHSDEDEANSKSLIDGLRMVHRQFLGAMSKLGITRVEALGDSFDPSLHDSIQHLHSSEYEAGQVMAVLQPGYRLGDELVRPAMVVVSKGPLPASEPDASDADDDDVPTVTPADSSPGSEPAAEAASGSDHSSN